MGFYADHILPRIVDFACGQRPLMRQRLKIVPSARGVVVDLGFGTGRNVPFYDPSLVEKVWAIDPSPKMWEMAEETVSSSPVPIDYRQAAGEALPLESETIDTVVLTYTLCTIPEPLAALAEVKRVLKPDGRLLFCEHGEAPDDSVRRWQRRLNPVWKRLGGGCNLERRIPDLIRDAGFDIDELSTMYIPGLKLASFNYWGGARATAVG